MTDFEAARQRLEAAIHRLETVVGQRSLAGGGERDALARELESVRQEYNELATVARQVSDRLDHTIERMRAVLGE